MLSIILLIFSIIIILLSLYLSKKVTVWWIFMVIGLILLLVAYKLYEPKNKKSKRSSYALITLIFGCITIAISAILWLSSLLEDDILELGELI